MKLELTKEICSLLQKAKLVISKNRDILPILSHGRVFSKEGTLYLEVTDLDNFLALKIGEDNFEGVCIPIEKTERIVKNFRLEKGPKKVKSLFNQKAYLEISKTSLEIIQEETKFSVDVLPSEDFPLRWEFSSENKFNILEEILFMLIKKGEIAVAKNGLREILSGVHFLLEHNVLSVIATDSHRMSLITYPIDFGGKACFTLSYPTISLLTKLLDKGDIRIEISQETKNVCFVSKSWNLLSRCVEPSYPECLSFIPKTFLTEITCQTKELKLLLSQIKSFLPKEKYICVKFRAKSNKMSIEQREINFSHDVECEIEGQEIDFEINSSYLLDVLNIIDSPKLFILTNSNREPILFCDYSKANLIEKHLIMPMRMDNET